MNRNQSATGPWLLRFVLLLLLAIGTTPALAQFELGGSGFDAGGAQEPVTFKAGFKLFEGTRVGVINIDTTLADHYHIYSTTQPPGGPLPTKVKVTTSDEFRVLAPFKEDRDPEVIDPDPVFESRVEQHSWAVTFFAPFEIAEGIDPQSLEITLKIDGLRCDNKGCLPFGQTLKAKYQGTTTPPPDLDLDKLLAKPVDEIDSQISTDAGTKTESDKNNITPHEIKKSLTEEEISKLRELYDPDSKIQYVTLQDTTGTSTLLPAIFGMLIGGLLLNLMPCVFPVLGLKVLGFVELGGSDSRRVAMHGLVFTLGIIFSMWLLAGTILAIKYSLGSDVNWGQQMGNSYFVGAIVILMFVLGLNLAGVFEIGLFMTRLGSGGQKQKGYSSSFFSGILTTFVATPCSGPFLGTAMSYTLAQEAWLAMSLFTVFAIGIGLPYLILSLFPNMIQALPRPGAWMETFKQLMSFALFAAAAFFFRSFAKQTGSEGAWWLTMTLCVIALGLYFYGRWSLPHVAGGKRFLWGSIAPFVLCSIGIWMYIDAASQRSDAREVVNIGGLNWEQWVPGLVEQRVSEGQMVWVDYTADWCFTCKVNEKRIFSNKAVIDRLKELNVRMVLVDMTARNQTEIDDLARADRSIIPVNLIYPADYPKRPAILLEELISPQNALDALDRVK